MSKSPHAAHLQMREDRRFAQLQRAWEKDQLLEMQRKLERWGLGVVELQSLFQTEYGKKNSIKKCCYSEQWSLTMVHPGTSEMRQSTSAQSQWQRPVGAYGNHDRDLNFWNSRAGVIGCWCKVKVQVIQVYLILFRCSLSWKDQLLHFLPNFFWNLLSLKGGDIVYRNVIIGCDGGSPFNSFCEEGGPILAETAARDFGGAAVSQVFLAHVGPLCRLVMGLRQQTRQTSRQEFQRQTEVQMEKAFRSFFFFFCVACFEREKTPSFLKLKPTIWREIYCMRTFRKVRNINQRDSRFSTLSLTPWVCGCAACPSAATGNVMFQEEQAERARLQQQRQKMKEDPELKPRC